MNRFVKKVADKVHDLRAKRAVVLSDEAAAAEAELANVKQSLETSVSLLQKTHPSDDDLEKLQGKVPQHILGSKWMKKASESRDSSAFSKAFAKCGRIQLDLGQLTVSHFMKVHERSTLPLEKFLESDFANLAQMRKKMEAAQMDYDACEARFMAFMAKASSAENPAKVQAAKDELEEFADALEKSKDLYLTPLFELRARMSGIIAPLVLFLEEQVNYYKDAAELIERAIPSLHDVQRVTDHYRVFGAPPEEAVAFVVRQCCAAVNRDGLDVEGIFRLAGSASRIRRLRSAFNSGVVDLTSPDAYGNDIHAVADLVKVYLRELPEPLLTFVSVESWKHAIKIASHEEKLYAIKEIIDVLPRPNYTTLRFLCRFFGRVTQRCEVNKMSVQNISIVFGPNILWSRGEKGERESLDTGFLALIAEALVTYADWLFPPEDGEPDPFSITVELPRLSCGWTEVSDVEDQDEGAVLGASPDQNVISSQDEGHATHAEASNDFGAIPVASSPDPSSDAPMSLKKKMMKTFSFGSKEKDDPPKADAQIWKSPLSKHIAEPPPRPEPLTGRHDSISVSKSDPKQGAPGRPEPLSAKPEILIHKPEPPVKPDFSSKHEKVDMKVEPPQRPAPPGRDLPPRPSKPTATDESVVSDKPAITAAKPKLKPPVPGNKPKLADVLDELTGGEG